MTQNRIFNFSAGPAVLPLPVLEAAQRDLVALPGVGMSVLEISHRSKPFEEICFGAEADFKRLAGVPDDYQVLFVQGGATLQFSMLPMNLLTPGTRARYDSTVVILHHFGYTEALPSLTALAGEMTEEEFAGLSAQDLFPRMVAPSGEPHRLRSSIRSVSYPDSTLAVVVVRTSEGSQEIPVRLVDDAWLVDLTCLAPPSEEGD
jgi:hypothetical protein